MHCCPIALGLPCGKTWRTHRPPAAGTQENRPADPPTPASSPFPHLAPQLLPYLLHGSRAAIRQVHFDRLRAQEDAYDAEFQADQSLSDEGYMAGLSEIGMAALWAFQDSLELRDSLLPPLLAAAVSGGAAALPLATARGLDSERKAKWGGAGAAWAEGWEPTAEVHARFPPRFRAAVRTLLLANHRGLPGAQRAQHGVAYIAWPAFACIQVPHFMACLGGPSRMCAAAQLWRPCTAAYKARPCPSDLSSSAATDAEARPSHLPSEVLLAIVHSMAAPGAEAAWVRLVEPLPSWVDLNSSM